MTGKKIGVKCPGPCPCPAPLQTSSTDKTGMDSDLRQSSSTLETTDLCYLICFCRSPVCSELDLKEVVSRLKDWFRVLHQNTDHERVKKPEKSSESEPEAAAVAARTSPPNSPEMLKILMNCPVSLICVPPQQSWRWGFPLSAGSPWVGCSLGWIPILTCSWTSRRSKASTWTGRSRAPTYSSNRATCTLIRC